MKSQGILWKLSQKLGQTVMLALFYLFTEPRCDILSKFSKKSLSNIMIYINSE